MPLPAPISSFETIIGPIELDVGGAALLYTAPGLRRISDIYLTNDNTEDTTVDLHIVPPDESTANSNKFFDDFGTIPNDVRMVTGLNYAINVGWKIYGSASATGVKLVVIAYR